MSELMIPIWRPGDAHEVFERAVTCAAGLRVDGFRFDCEQTRPHEVHTNTVLGAQWVDER